ncbi:hypothetical protein B566_EDAN006494 [Ephemera danica]|nr:hypothetical protein B566_EDAN006494 [Ephemera danica]
MKDECWSAMSVAQQFCLRWNNHQPNFVTVFSNLLNNQALTDVTLAAEGQHLEAHRVVLSACSTYFQSLFTTSKSHLHPIVILKDVQFRDLRTMVDFMYSGEVHVSQEQLPSILKTAETLKIKGLAEVQDPSLFSKSQEKQLSTESRLSCEVMGMSVESGPWCSEHRSPSPGTSPTAAQRRKRMRKASTGSTSESTVTERTSEEVATEVSFNQSPSRLEQQSSSQLTMSADMSERSGRSESVRQEVQQQHQQQQQQQQQGVPPQPRSVEEVSVPSPQLESTPHHYPATLTPGFQWDHGSCYYTRYPHPSCSFINTGPPPMPDTIAIRHTAPPFSPHKRSSPGSLPGPAPSPNPSPSPCPSSPPSSPTVRRKRTDTQRDENFLQALEAVRSGGIGFCKAARMYGVNNRTLWLEYRRRGYPITRPSLKPRASTPQMSPYPTYPAVVMKKEPMDSSCSNDDSTVASQENTGNPSQPVTPSYQDSNNPEIMFLQSSDIF